MSTLPAGFTETLVTTNSNLSSPTAMAFSPTGQLWVLEQGGAAKLVRNDGTTHTAANINVDPSGERGLLGIAFDPTYDGAGPNADFVYLYYTAPRANSSDPANNRVSRFTVSGAGGTTPTLGSELILRDLPPEDEDNNLSTDGDSNHNGGAIHFGPDGKLYVAVGDHNYDTTPQSSHVSQILTTPFGKILRLNSNGTNPNDNPFFTGSTTDWQGAVWALGLRNPFTFAFQPGGSGMFINDVGEGAWEEINQGQAAANYGWAGSTSPIWEGFESPPPPWTNYRDPAMAYDHSNSLPSPDGCAITGGVFYPANSQFGSAYAGKYFFADLCGSFIRVFDPANPGSVSTPDTSTGFATDLTSGFPVDLKVDSAGNLYFLARGGTGEIYRISATGQVGQDTIGLFAPNPSSFLLRNSLTAGAADVQFSYGPPQSGWTPLAGDWDDNGSDTAALYSAAAGRFFLRNTNAAGAADVNFQYGPGGQGLLPVVGDWDGDGRDTVGLFNPSTSVFLLRNSNSAGAADLVFGFGPANAGWLPIVGDWDGDGDDTVGLFNTGTSAFFLRNQHAPGPADIQFQYGAANAGWRPLAGDWNANGTDTVGLYVPNTGRFLLRNVHAAGPADVNFVYGPGGQGWLPLVGDWDAVGGSSLNASGEGPVAVAGPTGPTTPALPTAADAVLARWALAGYNSRLDDEDQDSILETRNCGCRQRTQAEIELVFGDW